MLSLGRRTTNVLLFFLNTNLTDFTNLDTAMQCQSDNWHISVITLTIKKSTDLTDLTDFMLRIAKQYNQCNLLIKKTKIACPA